MKIMADSFALYFQADFVRLNVMLFFAIKAWFSVTVIGTVLNVPLVMEQILGYHVESRPHVDSRVLCSIGRV